MTAATSAAPLSYLLSRLARQIRRGMVDMDVPGLSGPAVIALVTLDHEPGLSNAQLARRCFVSAQAMGEVVLDLERRGLLERAPDPANLRILRANPTVSGYKAISTIEKRIDELESRLFEGLSGKEIAGLRSAVERAGRNMDIVAAESVRVLRSVK
jgi:DNA-binding MarR family transcriptional regulator